MLRRWRRRSSRSGCRFAACFLSSNGCEFLRLRARLIHTHYYIAFLGHAALPDLTHCCISIVGRGDADQTAASERDAGQIRPLHIAVADRSIHLKLLVENRIGARRYAIGTQPDHVWRHPESIRAASTQAVLRMTFCRLTSRYHQTTRARGQGQIHRMA
jgi:hypothetical protein